MERLDAKRALIRHTLDAADLTVNRDGLTVGHVMTPAPATVSSELSVLELARLIRARGARHLLVTNGTDQLVGVISDRDVIRCFGPEQYPDEKALNTITAGQIMSTDLITIGPSAPLDRGVTLMVDHGISCLPVMASDSLVGIVTNTDLHLVLEILLGRVVRNEAEESSRLDRVATNA